jgi:hypothetical protein
VERCDGVDDDCDPSTLEDGLATWYDAAHAAMDVTADGRGAEGAPALFATVDPGALWLCRGTWWLRIATTANLDVHGSGTDATIVDGGGVGTVIAITGGAISASIENLTIQHGAGDASSPDGTLAGGGIACTGASSLVLSTAVISDNSAGEGGGVFSDGCSIDLADCMVDANTATSGGGVFVYDATASVEHTEISSNAATGYGGGLTQASVDGTAFDGFKLVDSLVSGNIGKIGGLWIADGTASCTGMKKEVAGFELNSGFDDGLSSGYAVGLGENTSFSADTCDFGT